MKKVILLDVDGVLVAPGGYRAALHATVKRFIGALRHEEELLAELEKRGIFSEWDMSPLILGAYWEDVLSRKSQWTIYLPTCHLLGNRFNINARSRSRAFIIPEFEMLDGRILWMRHTSRNFSASTERVAQEP
ncbi:MAG: hypothetical protein IPP55_09455 [Anaerolineales bacterium]|nr:hypothetical protein [Anaerolineales bacterium]